MKPILIDAGFLVAMLDRRERHHQICARFFASTARSLATCEPVLAEASHLLQRVPGATERLLENIAAGVLSIEFNLANSARNVSRLLRKYADQGMDLADACLVQMANELGTGDIVTLDSDFLVYRWGTGRAFHNFLEID